MFFSKIWFFFVAVAAAVAITIALVMPKPAERAQLINEKKRLQRACSVTEILLRDNARARIQLAGEFARASALAPITATASKGEIVSGEQNGKAAGVIAKLLKDTEGTKPDFVVLLDARGRVVKRTGVDDNVYGDSMAGYYLVDDALSGYVRDDVWLTKNKLYRVAASPILTPNLKWAGAVVLGHEIDKEFVSSLGDSLQVFISFYAAGSALASNNPVQVHNEVIELHKALPKEAKTKSCGERDPTEIAAGGSTYTALISSLPGEAGMQSGFYTVFIERPTAIGFSGTFDTVRKDDLSFASFPWIRVAILFVLIVGLGLAIMIWETDLPLRRLTAESVELAKGENVERMAEDKHRGKFGSIARSFNIVIDKLSRDARAAKKDLDQLIGPAPASAKAVVNAALPGMGSGPTSAPPPPSSFAFSDKKGKSTAPKAVPAAASAPVAMPAPADFNLGIPKPPPSSVGLDLGDSSAPPPTVGLGGGNTPPPMPGRPSPVVQRVVDAVSAPIELPKAAPAASTDAEYKQIYDDFIALKTKCGESIDNLNYEKFSKKLERNRDALISKHSCKSVKFQVYVKDGKAALKASPVK